MLLKIFLVTAVSSSLAAGVHPNVLRLEKGLAANTVPDDPSTEETVLSNHTVVKADFDAGSCCPEALNDEEWKRLSVQGISTIIYNGPTGERTEGGDMEVVRSGTDALSWGHHNFKGLCRDKREGGCTPCSTPYGGLYCPKGWACMNGGIDNNRCVKLRYSDDYCQMTKSGVGAMNNCYCNNKDGYAPYSWSNGGHCTCMKPIPGHWPETAACTDPPPQPPDDGLIKLKDFQYRWKFESSNADVTYTTKVTTSNTHKSSWSDSIKAGLKTKVSGKAGVPLVSEGAVEVEISLEKSTTYGEEFASTASRETGITVRPNCPQGQSVYAWVLQAKDANGEDFEVMSKHFACKKSHVPYDPLCTPGTLISDSDNLCCNAIFWDADKEKPEYLERLWEEAPGGHNGTCKYQPPEKTA